MRLATTLRYLYFAYLSKPVSDRALYRLIWQRRPRKILEIGVGSLDRTLRLLDFAGRLTAGEQVRYAAVDLFEARPKEIVPLPLKECHRLLKAAGASAQLIPGDPAGALARVANSMPEVDLVLISAAHDDEALAGAWFFLPRMLAPDASVLRETMGTDCLRHELMPASQIRQLAGAGRRRAA